MGKIIYTKELLEEKVKDCYSLSELCRRIGLTARGSNFKTLRKKLNEFDVDYSHFTGPRWNVDVNNPIYRGKLYPKLCEHSSLNTVCAKNTLYRLGIKENKCEICGTSEWQGKELVCELHHINGDSTDNRLENLIILCPNCHSQTANYAGRSNKKTDSLQVSSLSSKIDIDARIKEYEEEKRINRESNILSKKINVTLEEAKSLIKNSEHKSLRDFIPLKKEKVVIIKKCEICGKEFKVTKKRKEQKYCSYECLYKKQSENVPKEKDLINTFIEFDCNFTKVAAKYNVSDKAVVKWCIKYGLPSKKDKLKEFISKI